MPSFSHRSFNQARAAISAGRPEVAEELISDYRFVDPASVSTVLREIARSYVLRGRQHLAQKTVENAWLDLTAAEALNTGDPTVSELRGDLYRSGLAECRSQLDHGDPFRVLGMVQSLRDRRCSHPQLAKLELLAQAWVKSRELADRGEFASAREILNETRQKMGFLTLEMDDFDSEIAQRHERFSASFTQLIEALSEHKLQEAIKFADEALAVAPTHMQVRKHREEIWQKIRPETKTYTPPPDDSTHKVSPESVVSLVGGAGFVGRKTTAALPFQPSQGNSTSLSKSAPESVNQVPKRFFLWVDGGGGYLVCTGSHITIGQAGADAPIDIPIFADLAKVHATITRDNEGYVLESSRGAAINGKAVSRSILKSGDRITLGTSCQLTFDQPSPLSSTARLDLVSGHRFQTAVNAILLMADVLLLGNGDEPHVPLTSDNDVSLYRTNEGLGFRCPGKFKVDTFQFQERANLRLPANIIGHRNQFTFHLEPIGRS